mgnify:CR=1 FL=1
MAVTKEEVVEFIANMTVLELSEFIKELEEKFGVSAAAPAAAMMVAAPAEAAAPAEEKDRIRRHPEVRRRQQDRRHQGCPRPDRPRPEGSQGQG